MINNLKNNTFFRFRLSIKTIKYDVMQVLGIFFLPLNQPNRTYFIIFQQQKFFFVIFLVLV